MASNSVGISYGGDASFRTPLGVMPVVVTGWASDVTTTSALLSGTINPEGIATMGYFYYYSLQTVGEGFSAPQFVGSGTDPVPFSLVVTGLAPNTIYNFQASGTNTVGPGAGFGSYVPFATLAQPPPTVQTLAASFVTSINAQLNGSVNPNGAHTFAYFEYGTNTSYGSTTSPMDVGSGTSAQIANYTVSFPLRQRTTYYLSCNIQN